METVETITLPSCAQCGRTFGIDCERSNAKRDICRDCTSGVDRAIAKVKADNEGWLERAMEEGIPLWEQQPGESNEEFELWCSYQSLWPGVRPTVTKVSKAVDVTVSTVQRAYNKWTWGARLQAWIRECTAERTSQLRAAKRQMVDDHVAMGEALRHKALVAIEAFDPYDVTPNELVSLLKETQRLESTAREMLDDVERATATDIDLVDAPSGLFVDGASANVGSSELAFEGRGNTRGGLTEAGMLEVANILANAGVLKVTQTVEVSGKEEPVPAQVYIDEDM